MERGRTLPAYPPRARLQLLLKSFSAQLGKRTTIAIATTLQIIAAAFSAIPVNKRNIHLAHACSISRSNNDTQIINTTGVDPDSGAVPNGLMPTSASILHRLHRRAWASENSSKPRPRSRRTRLRQPFDIGQGSVWRSLLHMYAAEYFWLETILGDEDPLCPGDVGGQLAGNPLAGNQLGENPIESFAELGKNGPRSKPVGKNTWPTCLPTHSTIPSGVAPRS